MGSSTNTFSKILLLAVLVLTGSSLSADTTEIPTSKAVVPISYVVDKKPIEYGISNITMGISKAKPSEGQVASTLFDVSSNQVIIGDIDTAKFGIKCTDDNTCSILDKTPFNCNYNNTDPAVQATCVKASALVRFKTEELDAKKTYGAMEFSLLQDSTNYGFSTTNVFGLGPNSPLWKSIENMYAMPESSAYLQLSIGYKSTGDQTEFKLSTQKLEGSSLIFNGRKGPADPITVDNLTPTEDFFTFPGATLTFEKSKPIKSQNICILNNENFLIAVKDYNATIFNLNKAICGAANNTVTCNFEDSNIDKLPRIFVKIENKEANFEALYKPVDYAWFNFTEDMDTEAKEKVLVTYNIVDFDKYASRCSDKATMIVGRNFLLKTEFVMRKYKDKVMIGFNETEPKGTSALLIIIVLLFILVGAIVISIILLQVCKKVRGFDKEEKEEFDDDAYERAEAGEEATD